MKKVFLVFGIAAFSSVSAQQNDVFNIDKYLQKKMEDAKDKSEQKIVLPFNLFLQNKIDLSYSLPNGDKIIVLPRDNMPCVVPDMKLFQTMPVVKPDMKQFQTMPNVAVNNRIIHYTPVPQRYTPPSVPKTRTENIPAPKRNIY